MVSSKKHCAFFATALTIALASSAEAAPKKGTTPPPAPSASAEPAPPATATAAPTAAAPAAPPAGAPQPAQAAPAAAPAEATGEAPAQAPAAGAPAPAAPVESKVKPLPPPPPVVHKVTAPIIAAGAISGAALISGVVFAVVASGKHSTYVGHPDAKVAESGEQASLIADISFGMAALFGLAAIALYVFPDEPAPATTGFNLKNGGFRF